MATWTNEPESQGAGTGYLFLIDDTHFFLIDDTFKLLIDDPTAAAGWTNEPES